MTLAVISGVTILAGDSLSNAVDIGARGDIVRIVMPDPWGGGNLTFQISDDGVNYYDLHDASGAEITIPVRPGAIVPIGNITGQTASIEWFKIRAGSSAFPVVQDADRAFAVTVDR